MSTTHLPDCPTDCTGVLESVSFSECAPEVHFGEIAKLYLWVDSATPPFASQAEYNLTAHWNTHLNPAGTAIDDIREFIVIGEMPEPEQTETPISGDRVVTGYKKFVLNLEIDETNDINYNFIFASECNGKYKANFETADGILYGGWEGLDVSVKMNQVIPKERSGVVKIMTRVTWQSKNHPYRQISPLA
jgi:hypothetical protein